MQTKKCTYCEQELPLTDFGKNKNYLQRTGEPVWYYRPECKECHNESRRLKKRALKGQSINDTLPMTRSETGRLSVEAQRAKHGSAFIERIRVMVKFRKTVIRGVNQKHAKLNDELVRQIRQEYVPGVRGRGYTSLARKFGVSHAVIRNVVHRKMWAHVE